MRDLFAFRGISCGVLATLLLFTASACSLTRPDGNGGWSAERRAAELERASRAAAVDAATEPASPESVSTARLDLASALALAARHNRTLAIAAADQEMAARDVAVARAPLLPSTSVRGSYAWFSDPLQNTVELPPGFPGIADPVTVTVREEDYGNITAAVRLAIDISGELRHGLASSQASYRAERARHWGTQLEEERTVVQAYLDLLEAQRLHAVAESTVALHVRQFQDADSRWQVGRITQNEVLVVQVALSNSRQAVMRLATRIDAARRGLNRAVGLPIDAPTQVYDVPGAPVLPAVEDAVAVARRSSPPISVLLEEAQAIEEQRIALERARFPRFAATAAYDATTAEIVQPQDYASATLGVEWDLGTDWGRESRIARLRTASERIRLTLDRSSREIEFLVRSAHDAARERIAAADAAATAVEQAQENLRIRQEQFQMGRATSEDVLDADQLLTGQRATLATALYQAHARRAELQQLMGEPLSELLSPAAEMPSR